MVSAEEKIVETTISTATTETTSEPAITTEPGNGYKCEDFKDGGSQTTDRDYYCYVSKFKDNSQEFCIGIDHPYHECTDVSGGIRFEITLSSRFIRFNRKGETACQNYHPAYLHNLAKSLGYSTYVVNMKKGVNACPLVWLDGYGNWQSSSGNATLELPFNVTFSGKALDTTGSTNTTPIPPSTTTDNSGEFRKVLYGNCHASNIISVNSDITSLADAKLACAADNSCGSIVDKYCLDWGFQLCKSFYASSSQQTLIDCIHKKLELHAFPGEFLRSKKGKRCNKRQHNVLKEFLFQSEAIVDATNSRLECEEYCSYQKDCWGCSVDCDTSCRWNAIPGCGNEETWEGRIEGDISQKPVCFEVKVESVNMNDRWSIGSCSSDAFQTKYTNHDVNTNFGRCCLPIGEYVLICESESPYSWRQGFVEIQGRKYCDDFMGYKALRLVNITGSLPLLQLPQHGSESIFSGLVLRPPEGGCPTGTLGYKYTYTDDSGSLIDAGSTCMCEEHCAWDRCHLVKPPTKCLFGTGIVWKWNAENVYWVAQYTNDYQFTDGQHCGGQSIDKWADGYNSNYGTLKGLETCKTICNAHDECAGFVSRYDGICGFWKRGPLELFDNNGRDCYQKVDNASLNEINSTAITTTLFRGQTSTEKKEERDDLIDQEDDTKGILTTESITIGVIVLGAIFFVYLFHSPKKLMSEPKMLLGRSKFIFQIVCFILATYMTTILIDRYNANKDVTSIKFKKYNLTPRDKYPTFSLCFQGTSLYWIQDLRIFERYGLSTEVFEMLLQGKAGWIYEYNYQSTLYQKIPVPQNNESLESVDHLHLQITDFLSEMERVFESQNASIYYRNTKARMSLDHPAFDIGFQSAKQICFTRTSNDPLNSIRMHDLLKLNRSRLQPFSFFDDTQIEIFIHYPGQLIKSLAYPAFYSSFSDYHWDMLLEFRISQGQLLRKRPDSNDPCNPDIEDYDTYIMIEVSKFLDCIPPYWTRRMPIGFEKDTCYDPGQLKKAYQLIEHYKEHLPSLQQPCLEMFNAITYFWLANEDDEKAVIRFNYKETTYEEIEYSKDFGVESFVSSVGGFIGIFLGYSIMQFPELLAEALISFGRLKTELFGGMLFGFSLLKVTETLLIGFPVVRNQAKKRKNLTKDNKLHLNEVKSTTKTQWKTATDGGREVDDAKDVREKMCITDEKMMLQAFKREMLQAFEEKLSDAFEERDSMIAQAFDERDSKIAQVLEGQDSKIDKAILEKKIAFNESKIFIKRKLEGKKKQIL